MSRGITRERQYSPTELWENDKRLRDLNDGWGSCNTSMNTPGICNLGGIGCNVNHIEVARRNGIVARRTAWSKR